MMLAFSAILVCCLLLYGLLCGPWRSRFDERSAHMIVLLMSILLQTLG
jgi:hypothetical protein